MEGMLVNCCYVNANQLYTVCLSSMPRQHGWVGWQVVRWAGIHDFVFFKLISLSMMITNMFVVRF